VEDITSAVHLKLSHYANNFYSKCALLIKSIRTPKLMASDRSNDGGAMLIVAALLNPTGTNDSQRPVVIPGISRIRKTLSFHCHSKARARAELAL
jgi:hypothetical protein